MGTIDTSGSTNTSIIISGNTHSTNTGNIQYLATASAGSHIFYTASATTRMTISNTGVNINDNLGVVGRVGIGAGSHGTYQLDIQGTQPRLRVFDPATNGNSVIMFRELSDLYGMDISYIGNTDKKMYISTFNNSSTPVVRVAIDRISGNVAIGTSDTSTYKINVLGDINVSGAFSVGGTVITNSWITVPGTTNIYYSAGNVAIGSSTTQTEKLHITVDVRVTGALTITGGVVNTVSNFTLNTPIAVFQSSGSYDTTITNIINSFGSSAINFYLKTGTETSIGSINVSTGAVYFEFYKLQPITVSISNYAGTINRKWNYKTDGTCLNALNATTWNTTSDHRVKENIKKADLNICYNNVKNINVYRYNYIKGFKNNLPDKTQLGFIAQQVKQHFPKSVSRDKMRFDDKREVPDLSSVSVDQLNFTLFGAVKQLIRVVENQSKHIKKLEEMLEIVDDDEVEDDRDEPYVRMNCEDEVDIDTIERLPSQAPASEPSEPTKV